MTQAYDALSNTLSFTDEAFTGDLTIATPATAATSVIEIIGWNLIVTDNSAVALLQIKDTGGAIYAGTKFAIPGTNPVPAWCSHGEHFVFPVNVGLVVGGGGTAGKLNGAIYCRVRGTA